MIRKILLAGAMALLPFAASASTLNDGDVNIITDHPEWLFVDSISLANPDSLDNRFTFGFLAGTAPGAQAFSVILDASQSFIDTLTVKWTSLANGAGIEYFSDTDLDSDGDGNFVITNAVTFFPPDQQWLTVSWTDTGGVGLAGIIVEVEAIPLPAAGWLMLAGIGGLAAMKRRKKS